MTNSPTSSSELITTESAGGAPAPAVKGGRKPSSSSRTNATVQASLRRLRHKIVAGTTGLAAILLALAFAAICFLNYQQSASQVYEALNTALEEAGHGPLDERRDFLRPDKGDLTLLPPKSLDEQEELESTGGTEPALGMDSAEKTDPSLDAESARETASSSSTESTQEEAPAPEAEEPLDSVPSLGKEPSPESEPSPEPELSELEEGASATESESGRPPMIGGGRHYQSDIPMAVYRVTDGGLILPLPSITTASISEDILAQALTDALNSASAQGTLSDCGLLYAKHDLGNTTLVAFADESNASSWQTLALLLGVVGLIALGIIAVISVFFARWALRPVEDAWDQQQRFIADASHELKTPLTVILANLSIVRSHAHESVASQNQWIEGSEEEARRMQELVGAMLELARTPDPATLEASWTTLDFADLVEGEALQFESVAFENSLSLDCSVEKPALVKGDPARLERLVAALLDNACKYGRADTTVTVRVSLLSRSVALSVANYGPELSAEDCEHLFDRFYRADKARTRAQAPSSEAGPTAKPVGGYGLGLAIASDIVRNHNGSIAVSSTPDGLGGLTTFTVELPRL